MKMNFRLVRQLHLWIGAWGAIAAILFGFSGFLQNHRAVLKLPQGDSIEVSKVDLPVPEAARETPEALRAWLTDAQHLNIDSQRTQGGRPGDAGRPGGAGGRPGDAGRPGDGGPREAGGPRGQSTRWTFSGGNARHTVQAEYTPGSDTITVRNTQQSPLALMSRLHKGVGGGLAWILLGDSFALAMIALGISGLILWWRGRTWREAVFSIVGVAVVALLVIAGAASV
jgi:uncharacterized protein